MLDADVVRSVPREGFETELVHRAGLHVDNLSVTFQTRHGAVPAVRSVSLDLRPADTLTLVGESGSGKSTVIRALLRLMRENVQVAGDVRLDEDVISRLPDRQFQKLRGSVLGFVPQNPAAALDPLRRVGSQIAEVVRIREGRATRSHRRTRVLAALDAVGIREPERVANSHPHQLSGGQRQRAVIAMALSDKLKVLLADEPTTALDVTVQAQILDLFRKLSSEYGMSLLLVTHDIGVAKEMGGSIGVMYAGRIVESGPSEEILGRPQHPYTRALLESLPKPAVPRGKLTVIQGTPPVPRQSDEGCAFKGRCPLCIERCEHELPVLQDVNSQHAVACHIVPGRATGRPQ